MGTANSSKMLVPMYQCTRCHNLAYCLATATSHNILPKKSDNWHFFTVLNYDHLCRCCSIPTTSNRDGGFMICWKWQPCSNGCRTHPMRIEVTHINLHTLPTDSCFLVSSFEFGLVQVYKPGRLSARSYLSMQRMGTTWCGLPQNHHDLQQQFLLSSYSLTSPK